MKRAVALKIPERISVFALSQEFDVKWYGKFSYEETILNADKLAETHIKAIEEFDYDWAWLQVDDCIEFEVLGVGTKGKGNILRATCDYLPANKETLLKLKIPDPHKDGRMPILLEVISKIKRHFNDKILVCGRVAAPFSSTALLYGLQETMMLIFSDSTLLKETNEFFAELQKEWGKAQFEAGADAIWLGDCIASGHLLSLKQYSEFAFEPCRRLVQEYKKIGLLTFLHNSEESPSHILKHTELGVDAMNVGPGIDIAKAKEIVKGKTCLMGNLDPINILQNGTPEKVKEEIIRIIESTKKEGGYLFNTGECLPRETPEENIRAMVEGVREYGKY